MSIDDEVQRQLNTQAILDQKNQEATLNLHKLIGLDPSRSDQKVNILNLQIYHAAMQNVVIGLTAMFLANKIITKEVAEKQLNEFHSIALADIQRVCSKIKLFNLEGAGNA